MPGAPSERRDGESGIIGERKMVRGVRRRARLQNRVADKAGFGFFWLFELQLIGAHHMQAKRREQFANLAHLALIVACHHKRFAGTQLHAPITLFCSVTRSPIPFRASFSICANCSSVKGAPSAVP